MNPKRGLYLAVSALQRAWWKTRGGRRLRAMGIDMKLRPETEFPSHRRLRLPPGGPASQIVRYSDFVQMHAVSRCLETDPRPPVVVEVGAHHGAYAVTLGSMARQRRGLIVAIEPNPLNYEILCDNIRRNGLEKTVTAERLAIAEDRRMVRLSMGGSQSAIDGGMEGIGGGSFEVQAEPLSVVLARLSLPYVTLLLIDVEGTELQVLRSFPWESVRCGAIFCEMHPYNWTAMGYGPDDMSGFLKTRNLRCFDMFFHEYPPFPLDRRYVGPCRLCHANRPADGRNSGEPPGETEWASDNCCEAS